MSLFALGFAAELARGRHRLQRALAAHADRDRRRAEPARRRRGDGRARKPEIYADAAYAIVTRPSRECTGNTFLCEDVLRRGGRHRPRRHTPTSTAPSCRSTCSSTTSDRCEPRRRRHPLTRSRCCSRSWAASSTSLCRHSAARYTHAIRPVRCDAPEVAVDERVPGLGLVVGALGEPEVPLGVLLPRVRLQEGVLVVGARLHVAPVAVEHVLARVDELAGLRHARAR